MANNAWVGALPSGFPLAADAPGGFPVTTSAVTSWARTSLLVATTPDAMAVAKLGVAAPARLVVPVGTNKYATAT